MQSTNTGTRHQSQNRFPGPATLPTPIASVRADSECKALGALVLIRGLPGSGKSTMAKVLSMVGYMHFEADQFFEINGIYQYDPTRIRDAHTWCQRVVRVALAAGKRVVVSNTFTMLREIEPYLTMSENVRVIEATGQWENQHGVPEEVLKRMALRWEKLPPAISRL